MLLTFVLAVISLATMGMGYQFKKSWLLWLACPFWVMLGLYMAYYQTWFPATAQHSLILIALVGVVGCIFTATHMDLKGADKSKADDEEDDEEDDEDKEYKREWKKYKKSSSRYHTRRKPRTPNFDRDFK